MPERQCASCNRQDEFGCEAKRWRQPDKDEGDGPENWVKPAYMAVSVGDDESYACPRQTIREQPRDWNRLLMFYGMYAKGHLPNSGAVVDQSNVLIEAFRILDDANAECDRIQQENERRKRNREAGKGRGRG